MSVEPIYLEIGKRIASMRERRGLSQSQLGWRLTPQLSRSAICNMENGFQRIMIHVLADIAGALDCRATTLMSGPRALSIRQLAGRK